MIIGRIVLGVYIVIFTTCILEYNALRKFLNYLFLFFTILIVIKAIQMSRYLIQTHFSVIEKIFF